MRVIEARERQQQRDRFEMDCRDEQAAEDSGLSTAVLDRLRWIVSGLRDLGVEAAVVEQPGFSDRTESDGIALFRNGLQLREVDVSVCGTGSDGTVRTAFLREILAEAIREMKCDSLAVDAETPTVKFLLFDYVLDEVVVLEAGYETPSVRQDRSLSR